MDKKHIFTNKLKSAILDMFTVDAVDAIVQSNFDLGFQPGFRAIFTFKIYGRNGTYQFVTSPLQEEEIGSVEGYAIRECVLQFAASYYDLLRKESNE